MNKSYFKYTSALLLFGTNGIVASRINLTSYNIVLLRTLIGGVFLLLMFFISGRKLSFSKHPKDLLYISVSGVAMGASWMFLYEAYAQIGVGVSTLLYYSGPVIVMAFSPLVFKEKLTAAKLIGFLAVLCGVFLVNGSAAEKLNMWGVTCGCLSAVTYALMVIANKKAKEITGTENSIIQLITAFLIVAVFVGIKSGYSMHIEPMAWFWIVLLCVVNTGIGCCFYFSSLGGLPVQSVAILGYIEPLSAVVFSVIFLNEIMLPLQIAGAVLIIGGAIFGECFRQRLR